MTTHLTHPDDLRLFAEAQSIAAGTSRVEPSRLHVALLLSLVDKLEDHNADMRATLLAVKDDIREMQELLK